MHHSRTSLPPASTAPRSGWSRYRLPYRRLAVALLFAALVTACDSPEEKEAKHLERAIAYVEEGDDTRAMVELQNVLRLNPKNAEALYHAGLIHERAGNLPAALEAYQQATAEDPRLQAAQVRRGMLALDQGDLESASDAAAAIRTVDPESADAGALEAAVALREGDLQAAIDRAQAALEREPHHEVAVAVLVGAYHNLGQTETAIARLEEAIEGAAESVELRTLKIALLAPTDDTEAIVDTYREILAIAPQESGYRLALARFLRQQGDLAQAEAVLRQAIDDGLLDAEMADLLVQVVHERDGSAAAEAELKNLIDGAPEVEALRFLLAELHLREAQWSSAEQVLSEIAAKTQSLTTRNEAKAKIAQLKLTSGDIEGAEDVAQGVLEDDGQHRHAHLVLAQIALLRNDFDEAVREARTALRQDPNWFPGLLVAAYGHLGKGEENLAVDALNDAVRLNPGNGRAGTLLASLLTRRGDYDAALKIWDQMVRIGYEPAVALRARAEIAIEKENWSDARANIDWLAELPGQELNAALMSGHLLLAQRRFDQSREQFAKAQSMEPEAPGPTLGLANTYLRADDLDGGLAYLEQRTTKRPDDALAFSLKGNFLAKRGDIDGAQQAFERAIRLRPDVPSAYHQLGATLIQAGRLDDAAEVYQRALARWPDDPSFLNRLAAAYMRAGENQAAIETYRRLLERTPDADRAVNNYAALIADHRFQDQEALEHALSLASRFRSSDDPVYLDTLGWLHYRRGDFATAAALLERAVSLAPEQPVHRYHLGMALHRSGQERRALEELGRAVSSADADYEGSGEARAVYVRLRNEVVDATDPEVDPGNGTR